jgi:chromosome segregation ATPase
MQEEWMNAVTEVMDELRKALAELEDCRARNTDLRTMLEQVTRERDQARDKYEALAVLVDGYRRERDEAKTELEHYLRPASATESVRSAAKRRMVLDGADAQALENAITLTERERDEARAWQVQIAEPLGYLVRAFGVGGYDVAEPSVIVKAWRELERERDEARAEMERLRRERDAAISELAHMHDEYTRIRSADADQREMTMTCVMLVKERDEARAEAERLRRELERAGSRECDAPACNCGAWHHREHPRVVFRRGAEAMREACAQQFGESQPASRLWACREAADVIRALPIPEES